MSFKSKVLAAVATLTLVGGVGLAGALTTAGPAAASSLSCGGSCVNTFNQNLGPAFALGVLRQGEKVGQPIILFKTTISEPAEDYRTSFQGTVADFYQADLVDAEPALHYDCVPPVNSRDCYGQSSIPVNEPIEYAPYGAGSGLCASVTATASSGEGVTLPAGGVPAKTLGIADIIGNPATLLTGSVPQINSANTNFSQTSPPFLIISRPELGTVNDSQLWVADFGGGSGLCASVTATASSGEGVTLPAGGVPAKTLGIADIIGNPATLLTGSVPQINSANTNFSQPFVLAPDGSYRTGMSLPHLQADNITDRQAVQPGGTA